jgi:hypothetical protein
MWSLADQLSSSTARVGCQVDGRLRIRAAEAAGSRPLTRTSTIHVVTAASSTGGSSLMGRTVVYGSVSESPERYYPALAALNQLVGGDGEVITAASVFGQGQYKSTAERIEAYSWRARS